MNVPYESRANCCFLTCIQVSQEAGQVVWYSHLYHILLFIVIHTIKGFGIVNKAEIDVFLELSCFFHDPADVGNLVSGSSAFYKSNLNTWEFTVHILLKPGLKNFEHYFLECEMNAIVWYFLHYLAVPWALFGIVFLEWKLTFSSPMGTAEFSKFASILSVALSQHHLLGFEFHLSYFKS